MNHSRFTRYRSSTTSKAKRKVRCSGEGNATPMLKWDVSTFNLKLIRSSQLRE